MKNKILITLDYELFFGSNVGTQQNCIIYPTNRLINILDKYNVKATFFVDSGYLVKLEEEKEKYISLEKEYQEIVTQIKKLDKNGHSIQLHIHPHWEDSYYDGKKWIINTKRYRLHDFNELEIEDIVFRYKKVLTDIIGDKIFAHRAGGWCIQPFNKLKNALKKHNIWLDSTVFENGKNSSKTHYFDFKNSPKKSCWNFEEDPLIEEENGFFKEFPISSYKLSPIFFWKLVFFKKFGSTEHNGFGDGTAAGGSKKDKIRMLTSFTNSVVSIDGYKSSFLQDAYNNFLTKRGNNHFVIIGHPKAMSEYSLKKLENFIIKNNSNNFISMEKLKRNYITIKNYKINAFESKNIFLEKIEYSKKILIAMNAEKIMKNDKKLKKIINNNIGYTDGFGAVIALRIKGLKAVKLAGSELWLDIIKKFEKTKTFYFIGSTNRVIENTIKKLKKEYPQLKIVGYRDGFLEENDKEKLILELKDLKPDIVFVAQGSPRQEFLMDELIAHHPALYMGLGGSFDIYGGDKKRAPKLFLTLELEWLYRLIKEPTRVGRQFALIKFIIFIGEELFSQKINRVKHQ